MGIIDVASRLLLLVAVATGIFALIVIYSRKRRQAQGTAEELRREAEEAQRKIEDGSRRGAEGLQNAKNGQKRLDGGVSPDSKGEDQRREVEQEAIRRAEEGERQRLEAKRRQIEEELRKAQEERHKADEERKRLDEEARRMMEESRRKAEVQRQTEELRKSEEEHRRAQEQQKCREADEAQRKAEEETHRKADELQELEKETSRKGEEEQRKAGDETCHKAEEEARQRAKEDRERRQIPLDQRPPRRQPGLQEPSEKPRPRETKQRRPKPEVICWKRERQWILGVEVPEELLGKSNLVVLQNASPVTQDEYREGCWRLEQAFGEVMIHWNEDEDIRESKIPLSQENYLLFKLSGQNQNQGRYVKSPSSGSYLVVVPETWERDEALSGQPPVAPEFVSTNEYRAHFFTLEKDGSGKIAFRIPDGNLVVIEPKASRFELTGNRLDDATEDIGPLFGKQSPQIRAPNDSAWNDVGTIVVGEEGGGQGKWRIAFSPVPGLTEQDLSSEIAARKGGWFFLRFYDTNDQLIDSLDFRFISALKKIRIFQPSPLPSEDGHKPVSVEFLHEPGCVVQPADNLAHSIQIERENDKTILTIPPDPTCDETRYLVGPQVVSHVEVTILVERLWWAVGEEDNAPSEWEDQLLTLLGDDFAATSKKALWLRLPRRRWLDKVLVGFEQPKARPYTPKVMEKTVGIPLRDFGDSQEVGDRAQEHLFKVWIKRDDGLLEKAIAIIPAEPPVVVRQESPVSRLNLAKISAPRMAGVLARLQRVTSGPLFMLIKEARKAYPRAHVAHPAASVNFVKKALCVIAFSLELGGEEHREILRLKNRWTVRARRARDEYPEVMSQLRNRYGKLKTRRAHQASSMRERTRLNESN